MTDRWRTSPIMNIPRASCVCVSACLCATASASAVLVAMSFPRCLDGDVSKGRPAVAASQPSSALSLQRSQVGWQKFGSSVGSQKSQQLPPPKTGGAWQTRAGAEQRSAAPQRSQRAGPLPSPAWSPRPMPVSY